MPDIDTYLLQKITQLKENSLYRSPVESTRTENIRIIQNGKKYISFSCNDYLGLSHHPEVKAAAISAIEDYGVGGGASRLISGNHPLYTKLESQLASLKKTEDAVVFGSGYLANMGTIASLMDRRDLILIDKLAHACLLDGAKLSGAKILRFRNNDVTQCQQLLETHRKSYRNCLVITDAVFSMDGHLAPVEVLTSLVEKYDSWLMTDDAHGLGVLSSKPETANVTIQSGTLSKAVGGYGGYVCGSKTVCDYLRSRARTLVYSTALPPATLAAASKALEIIENDKELTATPLSHAQYFTEKLGIECAQSPIIPLVIGEEKAALSASETLKEHGFLVSAIRPPTVPKGSSRLRFTFSALHKREEIATLAELIQKKNWVI